MERISGLARLSRFRPNPYGRIDPRGLLKQRQREGDIETIVPHDAIPELAEAACRVLARFQEAGKDRGLPPPLGGRDILKQL